MPWKQHTPGCASCSCGCARLHDDFSTDTIASYTQFSGTWAIADGALSTSSANGVIKSNTTGAQYQKIVTRFRSTERETVDLIGGMASYMQYVAARVEFDTSGTCGWLSIENKTATGTAQLGERLRVENLDPDGWHLLALCVSPTEDLSESDISATLESEGSGSRCIMERLEQTTSNGVGLGTGGLGELVEFDFLDWSDSAYLDNGCPPCDCECVTSGDTFQRQSSELAPEGTDDVGCLWSVCSNFWKTQSGFLVGYASDTAGIKHLVPFDSRATDWFASVEAIGQPGTKAILHLGYDCTAGPAVVVEFRTGYKRSRLYLSDDGGASVEGYPELIDTPPGDKVKISGCLKADGDLSGLAVGATTARVSKPGFTVGDPFAGLGVKYHTDGVPTSSGSRLPVFFDNYEQGKGGAPCGLCWEVESSDLCDFCEDETPLTVLVGLPALSPASYCNNCGNMEGNYLLSISTGGPFGTDVAECCGWTAQVKARGGDGPCAGDAYASAYLCKPSENYRLVIELEYLGNSVGSSVLDKHRWKIDLGPDAPDCLSINETLSFWSSSAALGCTATGTTATIKAV